MELPPIVRHETWMRAISDVSPNQSIEHQADFGVVDGGTSKLSSRSCGRRVPPGGTSRSSAPIAVIRLGKARYKGCPWWPGVAWMTFWHARRRVFEDAFGLRHLRPL